MKNRILKMSSIILLTIVIVTINTISAFACQTNDESIKDITIIEERNNISDINYSENQITRAEPYFPIELESAPLDIIGEDDRIPTYNYAVCALEAKWDDGCRGLATAFMVGPNIALTSAHCIYSIETNENFVTFNFQSLVAGNNAQLTNAQMLLVFRYLNNEIINNKDFNKKYRKNICAST